MYANFAKDAREEGFKRIAALFEGVGKIEKAHEERYLKLLSNLEEGIVFSRDGEQIWKCDVCGHIHVGKKAPEVCPICAHPQAHFEISVRTIKDFNSRGRHNSRLYWKRDILSKALDYRELLYISSSH